MRIGLAFVGLVAGLLLAGCTGELSREGGPTLMDSSPPTDSLPPSDSAMPTDSSASDSTTPPTDSGMPVDSTTPMDTGPRSPCDGVACMANARCEASTGDCVCNPGFLAMGGACDPIPPGDPAGRTAAELCAIWNDGHEENASPGWTAGPTQCDPGTLHEEAIPDTLRRINMYRAMVGLEPATDDPAQHPDQQLCAVMMRANGSLSHDPPTSWTCYTSEGAGAAGRSNLALGARTPAQAVDLYIGDRGVDSLGHRRWVLNFPLGKVGVGYAGAAECLGVFDRSGRSSRTWTAWPNHGPTVISATTNTWSWHSTSSVAGATVEVVRVSDGMTMPISSYIPPNGFGVNAVAWTLDGWSAAVGETYRVTISGVSGAPITYEVEVVSC